MLFVVTTRPPLRSTSAARPPGPQLRRATVATGATCAQTTYLAKRHVGWQFYPTWCRVLEIIINMNNKGLLKYVICISNVRTLGHTELLEIESPDLERHAEPGRGTAMRISLQNRARPGHEPKAPWSK